ncbi:hypothetical protein Z043_121301 [Scleropages formosus]|uniref:Uncharacterized protein n=1 Tax=Scleropages formosus TaxID=113540 RepID=A0A0P7Y4U3_SCLFO|nr:hypothetical protein Z043_121301 [Scleropages formosus]
MEFRSPSHLSGLNRSASLSCTDRSEPQSVSGSSNQLNSIPPTQYTPDFNVRALTDLQFVKITRSQYQNGLMASRLDSTPQSPESARTRLEQLPAQPLEATENGPDETTSLLNDQNCLPARQSNHNSHSEGGI